MVGTDELLPAGVAGEELVEGDAWVTVVAMLDTDEVVEAWTATTLTGVDTTPSSSVDFCALVTFVLAEMLVVGCVEDEDIDDEEAIASDDVALVETTLLLDNSVEKTEEDMVAIEDAPSSVDIVELVLKFAGILDEMRVLFETIVDEFPDESAEIVATLSVGCETELRVDSTVDGDVAIVL